MNIDLILKTINDYLGVKQIDVKGKKRTKEIANARQIAMYITKQLTTMSLSDIGRAFGGKDHATVIYSCKTIEKKRSSDENLNKMIEQIIRKIKAS